MDFTDYRKDYLKIAIDLRNVKSERVFLMKMQEIFQFPSYFWLNFNSLDDCMLSLDWVDERTIEIDFFHLEELKDKNNSLYIIVKESLTMYKDYWQKREDKQVTFNF